MTDTKYEVGKWYKTRDGHDVKIDKISDTGSHPIFGFITVRRLINFCIDGRYLGAVEHDLDLMPPVETKEFWINLYPQPALHTRRSKISSDENALEDRIGLLKITVTGDKYEVEKVGL